MNELIELLRKLGSSHFFGSVEVKFEAGIVTIIKRTESIKPNAGDHQRTNHRNN